VLVLYDRYYIPRGKRSAYAITKPHSHKLAINHIKHPNNTNPQTTINIKQQYNKTTVNY